MNVQRILRHIFHTRFTSYSGCFRAVQHLLKNHTAREGQGRADVIIETDDDVFIFEFKLDGSAEEALKQIEEKQYAVPYQSDNRPVYKIGVNISSESRTVNQWLVAENRKSLF